MKKIYILFSGLLLSMLGYAQAPQGINYQGVARNSLGNAISNTSISVKFQIHSGSTSGTVVFTETQSATTDTFGLYSLVIGSINPLSSVNWSAGPMFLQIDIDPGTGYVNIANTQLMSVPYALYSGSSTTGVTVVTSSSPLNVTSGTTTPHVTINKASGTQSGYLDSTDWTTFNNKGNGTVTSITGGTGIDGGTITVAGTFSLSPSGVAPNSYGSASAYPVITVDNMGRITSASTQTVSSGNVVMVNGPELITSVNNNTVTISANSGSPLWNADKIQSAPVVITGAANGQVLQYSSGTWVNANTTGGTVTSFSAGVGLLGGPISTFGTIYADTTSPIWNAKKIQSIPVNAATPNPGDILRYNGTQWAAVAPPSPNGVWLNNGNTANPGDFLGTNNGIPMIFKANGNEAMRIEALSGFVGINTGTVQAVARLDVAGNMRLGGSKIFLGVVNGINDGMTGLYEQSGDLNIGVFKTGGGGGLGTKSIDAVTIKSSTGFVGIGNNFPSAQLDVPGRIRTDTLVIVNNAAAGKVLMSDGSGNGTWQTPTGGGVTSVTVNSPLVNSGTVASPTLSINQASASTDGYLSKVDWNNFNGKISNVTTVAPALTSTTTAGSTTITANNSNAIWNANQLQGQPVSATAPGVGQVLTYTTGNWVPANPGPATVTTNTTLTGNGSGTPLSLAVMGAAISVGGSTAIPVINTDIYGRVTSTSTVAISGTLPAGTVAGHVLFYNGSAWTPSNVNNLFFNGANVGIGTSGPAAPLHILGTNAEVRVENTGGAFKTGYTTKTATQEWFLGQENGAPQIFRLRDVTANAVRLEVAANGNVGIGASPNASAILDVVNTSKGMLIPRVGLTQTNSAAPIAAPATSLLVFNTATVNDVFPGFYFWDGATWQRFATGSAGNGPWSTLGNAGTIDGTNFIGTTDNVPLTIKVNNQRSGRMDGNGNLFLGLLAGNTGVTGVRNTAIGYDALIGILGGNDNIAMGSWALQQTTASNQNVAIGMNALNYNVAGSNAIAIGVNALQFANNTSTSFTNYNVAVGFESIRGSTTASANTGNYNTAVGYQTLWSNTSGPRNTANGNQALYSNTTGNDNTANGFQSLYFNNGGGGNIANGNYSLYSNTTGSNNVATGANALYSNTVGGTNVANGNLALYYNVAGSSAVAIGNSAMYYSNNTSTAFTNYNIAVGFEALRGSVTPANNTGNYNSALGYQTLWSNTTGGHNTANGTVALYTNTTGNENTANGSFALYSNTTGNYNTATGSGALQYNTTAAFNTANGNSALNANTTGNNTAIGYRALFLNTTGTGNTASGINALRSNTTANYNTATGEGALYTNTTGANNTGIGYQVLWNNTTISQNTAMGYQALYSQSFATAFASDNIAIGHQALYTNNPISTSTGYRNIAVGTSALFSNTVGDNNLANGWNALYANTTGYRNVGVGTESIRNNISGNNNTAFGYQSGLNNTTGTNNTFVGYSADLVSNATQHNNATAIGYNAKVDADNALVLGGTGAFAVNVGIGTTTPGALLDLGPSTAALTFRATNTNTSSGVAGYFNNTSATNTAPALQVSTVAGTAFSGQFTGGKGLQTDKIEITNGAMPEAVLVSINASGDAIWAGPINFSANNSSTSIASAGLTNVVFATIEYNNSNSYNNATGIFTAPVAGIYHFDAGVSLQAVGNYDYQLQILKNSGTFRVSYLRMTAANASFDNTISTDMQLNAGDVVNIAVYQTSGAATPISASSTYVFFTGHKIH